jgi:hypothetical protein
MRLMASGLGNLSPPGYQKKVDDELLFDMTCLSEAMTCLDDGEVAYRGVLLALANG